MPLPPRQSLSRDAHAGAPLRLYAIVLAAGSARRFGAVKQLARLQGETLAARAVRLAEQLCGSQSVLVTGHAGQAVHNACAPLRGFLVHNENYADGIGSSIACVVTALARAADGVLVLLADQPLVTPEHLANLAARWRQEPEAAVASRYAGTVGVPAIFPAGDFPALKALRGDRGARPLLLAHGDALATVECEAASADIDRPADLEALQGGPP